MASVESWLDFANNRRHSIFVRRILTMTQTSAAVEITLRIPGDWAHPREVVERLPPGFRLTPEGLTFPDGRVVEVAPLPPDKQFAEIFRSSCRQPPTAREQAVVGRYTVNMALMGPGGSLDAARTMMQAAAAIIEAGAAGVFIDNSGVAHGGNTWLQLTEDGGPDAMSFAFVSIIRGDHDAWTMGMHALGLPEISMRRADIEPGGNTIIEVLCYMCQSEKPVDKGHVLVLEHSTYHVIGKDEGEFDPGSPMHNPFGILKLLPAKDLAERN